MLKTTWVFLHPSGILFETDEAESCIEHQPLARLSVVPHRSAVGKQPLLQ